jgi:hypothetical protein
MTKREALALVQTVDDCIQQHPGGWRDEVALSTIGNSIHCLYNALPFAHFEMAHVRGEIRILYSDRKWKAYGGCDRVRGFLHHSVSSLRMQLERRPDEHYQPTTEQ